jgi:hypothetical protein
MMRKILLAVGIVLVVLVGTAYLIHRLAEFVRKADSAQAEKLVPAIVKGDGQFEKRVFYSSYGLGSISQILVGWPADKEGAAVAVVGNKEAHFLDLSGQLKKQIRFTGDLNCPIEVARLDASGDYAYLTRDEGSFFSATLLDKEGQVRWSSPGGELKGVDDSVSGDVYGDRKLWVVIEFNGGGGLALINGEGKEVWRKKEATFGTLKCWIRMATGATKYCIATRGANCLCGMQTET